MEWYMKVVFDNYANYKSRARRKEYWMFFLFHIFVSIGIGIVIGLFKLPPAIVSLYSIGILLPSVCVGIRRMHDTNHSGWWILCPLYNLVLLCSAGDQMTNRFGPDPKGDPTSQQRAA